MTTETKPITATVKTNKAFKAAAASIVTEKVAVQQPRRQHGRPKGGRVIFKQCRISALPKIGGASDMASALGIERMSFHQWCGLKANPLPYVIQDGRKLFRRDVLTKWLIATRRYKRQAEYDHEK